MSGQPPKRQPTGANVGKNAYAVLLELAHDTVILPSYDLPATMRRYLIPIGAFLIGSALIMGVYLGFLTLTENWDFALSQLGRDSKYVVPIIVAFGVQSSLYSILRFRLFVPVALKGPGEAMMGASGGTSATAMVACCLHHATSVLPILGLSAATAFIARYQQPFLKLSLAMNILGILLMLAILYRERQRSQPLLAAS